MLETTTPDRPRDHKDQLPSDNDIIELKQTDDSTAFAVVDESGTAD